MLLKRECCSTINNKFASQLKCSEQITVSTDCQCCHWPMHHHLINIRVNINKLYLMFLDVEKCVCCCTGGGQDFVSLQ